MISGTSGAFRIDSVRAAATECGPALRRGLDRTGFAEVKARPHGSRSQRGQLRFEGVADRGGEPFVVPASLRRS